MAHAPPRPNKARRAWITYSTMELLAHRKALLEEGLLADARGLGKLIRANARQDKQTWLESRLEENFWDPVKELTHKSSPQVATLKKGLPGAASGNSAPAQVYAEHLRDVHWAHSPGNEGGEMPDWGTAPMGQGDSNVSEAPITLTGLNDAIRATARGKAPGVYGIPPGSGRPQRGPPLPIGGIQQVLGI